MNFIFVREIKNIFHYMPVIPFKTCKSKTVMYRIHDLQNLRMILYDFGVNEQWDGLWRGGEDHP